MAQTSMAIGDDSGEEDEESVHSAISNASDFEDDEEVEYLAMELVNHLPPEQASKLLKNMRTKEKAVQDLLHRNRSLLDSCQQLDQENQALTDRLKVSQSTVAAPAAPAAVPAAPLAAPAAPPAAAGNVDTSYFAKMERGKEEKILILQRERDQIVIQFKRLEDGARQTEAALVEARKEVKKLQQQVRVGGGGGGGGALGGRRSDPDALQDEEERLFRELQGKDSDEYARMKLQQRQEEHKKRIQAALKALLTEDLDRIQRWGSDIAALMLAVDGLEGRGKAVAKASAKKGKAAAPADAARAVGERLSDLQAELVDDFDALKVQLEESEKAQLSLEQTFRGIQDGAEATAVAMAVDVSLLAAEKEVDWLGQYVARMEGLALGTTSELLERSEAAVAAVLRDAPPGLIPPNAEVCLQGTKRQIAGLRERLEEQARSLAEVQEGSESRLRALKAAHRAHREEVRRRMAEELQRSARALEAPVEQVRSALRHSSEAFGRSRARVLAALEEMSALARRAATSSDAHAGGGAGDGHGGGEVLAGGIREVRSMCKTLISGLDDSAKALESRMDKVFAALVGEDPDASGTSFRGRPGGGAAAAAGRGGPVTVAATADGGAEAKKKKGKKRGGKTEVETPHSPRTESAAPAAAPAALAPYPAAGPAADGEALPPAAAPAPGGEAEKPKRVAAGPSPTARGVLKGAELLQELQALKGESDALEARMAERRKAKESPGGLPELARLAEILDEDDATKPAPKARRKKMFV